MGVIQAIASRNNHHRQRRWFWDDNKNTLGFELLGQISLNMTASYHRYRIMFNYLRHKERKQEDIYRVNFWHGKFWL